MRRKLLPLLALPVLLGACSLTDSLSQALNVFDVAFSSADPAYTGPTVSGPNPVQAALELALPVSLGGKTKNQVLGEYALVLTFHVKADNSKNNQPASFGQTVQPVLYFRINSRTADPITSTMEPFSVAANSVGSVDFPVSVPLTTITDTDILKEILAGTPIPYFLSGSLNFNLLNVDGLSVGAGTSEIDLATGAIPTRPSGSWNLSDILQFL